MTEKKGFLRSGMYLYIAHRKVNSPEPEVYIPQMVQVYFPGTIPGVPVFFPDFSPIQPTFYIEDNNF